MNQMIVGCGFVDGYQNYCVSWSSDEMMHNFMHITNGVLCLEIPHFNMRPNLYFVYYQISLWSTFPKDFCDVMRGAASINILSSNFFVEDMTVKPNRGYTPLIEAFFSS